MPSRGHLTGTPTRLIIAVAAALALVAGLAPAATAADTGTISGVIGVPAGFSPEDVRVRAHPEGLGSYSDVEGYPRADGSYTLTAPAGRYKLEFDFMDGRGDLLRDEWYSNAATEAEGAWVTIGTGSSQRIDASLEAATDLGTIRGTVTWPNGTPAADAMVRLYHPNEFGSWNSMYLQEVASDGSFSFRMRPGTYVVGFDSFGGYLAGEYWRDQTDFDAAEQITLAASGTVTTNAQLACVGSCATATVAAPDGVAVGRTVSASTSNWHPTDPVTYQWLRGTTPIAGATAQDFVLTTADLGQQISVRVTEGSRADQMTNYAVLTSPKTAAVAAGSLMTATPTIATPAAGALVGQRLDLTTGTWGPTGVALAIQWQRGTGGTFTDIAGATGTSHTLTAADLGATIRATVTGSLTGYTTTERTSAETATVTAPVVAPTPVTGPTPTLTGTARVGRVLTAGPGSWSPSSATLTYQWLRNGSPIAGARSRTYTLARADVNRSISVRVTGTAPGHTATSKTSAARKVLAATSSTTVSTKGARRAAIFTIRVTATGVTATGKVTVKLGGRTLKTGTLSNGRVVVKATKLAKGRRTFTVAYAGGNGVAASSVRKTVTIK